MVIKNGKDKDEKEVGGCAFEGMVPSLSLPPYSKILDPIWVQLCKKHLGGATSSFFWVADALNVIKVCKYIYQTINRKSYDFELVMKYWNCMNC